MSLREAKRRGNLCFARNDERGGLVMTKEVASQRQFTKFSKIIILLPSLTLQKLVNIFKLWLR